MEPWIVDAWDLDKITDSKGSLPMGHRAFRSIVVVLAVGLSISGCSGTSRGSPGDPGGRLMAELRKTTLPAVPAGFPVSYRQFVDSHWDSCDGVPSTAGYDPVSITIVFKRSDSEALLERAISRRLRAVGWHKASKNHPGVPLTWPPGGHRVWTDTSLWNWSRWLSFHRPALLDVSIQVGQVALYSETPATKPPPTGC